MKIQNKVANTLYAGVMLAPLIAVGTSCAYSIFNKNATEQMTRTESVKPTALDNTKTYHFENTSIILSDIEQTLGFSEVTNIKTSSTSDEYANDWQALRSISSNFYLYANRRYYVDFVGSFDFKPLYSGTFPSIYADYITEVVTYTETRDLRNTFYYSLDRVQEEDVFKWANNSPFMEVYTPFANFFGVTDSSMPFLLSYWTSVSLVMFGYEIITFMVSFARNLMHKFEDKAGGF